MPPPSSALGAAFWDDVFGAARSAARSPRTGYGPRCAADEHGLRLPEGFRSRLIARGDEARAGHRATAGTSPPTAWPPSPTGDGGWVLVSNSETPGGRRVRDALRPRRRDRDAYRILERHHPELLGRRARRGAPGCPARRSRTGTSWECDPTGGERPCGARRMGVFKHEAAAVDPRGRRVYLTEDLMDGGLYRFTPTRWRDLARGPARDRHGGGAAGGSTWTRGAGSLGAHVPTRAARCAAATRFKRAEGIWHDDGIDLRLDHRATAACTPTTSRRERIASIYDGLAMRPTRRCSRVDQLTASRAGEVFVCEDIDHATEIDIGVIDRRRRVSKFLSVTGPSTPAPS